MEDSQTLMDEQIEAKLGSGKLLAAARKEQKRSVEEIAELLNLSVSQIRTIELDQNEGLPEPTYVRGYIRAYARLLDLNADEVLEHYLNPNWQKGSSLDEMPKRLEVHERHKSKLFTPFRLLALVAIVGAGAFYVMTRQPFGETPSIASPATQTAELQAPQSQTSTTAAQSTSNSASPSDSSAEQPAISESAGEVSESPATSDDYQIALNFSDTCWVDIRDEEGKRLAYKSYTAGEELNLSSPIAMSVFLGNASAVTATVDGQAFDLEPYREGVFARFSIPRQ